VPADFHPAHISAAFDGAVWTVDESGNVWRYNARNNNFVQVGSGMASVVVGGDAAIWALDPAGRIYQYW
jgi:hypothetical protein